MHHAPLSRSALFLSPALPPPSPHTLSLHDALPIFLPRIVHSSVLADLKTGGHFDRHKLKFFHWRNEPFMPVEFSVAAYRLRSEEHTSELQSRFDLVCRLLLEKKNSVSIQTMLIHNA